MSCGYLVLTFGFVKESKEMTMDMYFCKMINLLTEESLEMLKLGCTLDRL